MPPRTAGPADPSLALWQLVAHSVFAGRVESWDILTLAEVDTLLGLTTPPPTSTSLVDATVPHSFSRPEKAALRANWHRIRSEIIALGGSAAGIDPTVPVDGSPAVKASIRANLAAIKVQLIALDPASPGTSQVDDTFPPEASPALAVSKAAFRAIFATIKTEITERFGAIGPVRTLPSFITMGTKGTHTNTNVNVGFTYPGGILENDFILAVVAVNDRGGGANITSTATGWTFINKLQESPLCVAAFYRWATGSESSTTVQPFDWDSVDTGNRLAVCTCWQFRNVDRDNPIDGLATSTLGNLTTLGCPRVSTVKPNSLAVAAIGYTDNVAESDASGEVGGDWVTCGGVGDAAADDARVAVFRAALATVGSISGGSISITPTTTPTPPVSTISGALGFALRGAIMEGSP